MRLLAFSLFLLEFVRYIYILFLLLGQVSLCCVSSHDIITSPLFTMMQSSADVDREVKLTPRTGGCFGSVSPWRHRCLFRKGRAGAVKGRQPVSDISLFFNSQKLQKSERKGGCRAPGAVNVQTRRQRPQVQYPNAVVPPQNRVYPNRTAPTSVPRPPRVPSRFKNVISPCSSEQFQP